MLGHREKELVLIDSDLIVDQVSQEDDPENQDEDKIGVGRSPISHDEADHEQLDQSHPEAHQKSLIHLVSVVGSVVSEDDRHGQVIADDDTQDEHDDNPNEGVPYPRLRVGLMSCLFHFPRFKPLL